MEPQRARKFKKSWNGWKKRSKKEMEKLLIKKKNLLTRMSKFKWNTGKGKEKQMKKKKRSKLVRLDKVELTCPRCNSFKWNIFINVPKKIKKYLKINIEEEKYGKI